MLITILNSVWRADQIAAIEVCGTEIIVIPSANVHAGVTCEYNYPDEAAAKAAFNAISQDWDRALQ